MGKKKGSKKKGSKKKGGASKITAPVGDPLPPAPERFMLHQLDARGESIQEIYDERDGYFDENEDVVQQQQDLGLESERAMGRIREQETGMERRIKQKEEEYKIALDGARNDRAESIAKDKAEIEALERELARLEKKLGKRVDVKEMLEHHRHVLSDEWDTKIADLNQNLENTETNFVDNQQSLGKQFKTLKLHFGESLELKLLNTKQSATASALRVQPVVDKIAYKDNGWLRHELLEQERECDRVCASIRQLQTKNQKLAQELFGDTATQQKYSPDKLLRKATLNPRRKLRSVHSAPSLQSMQSRPISSTMTMSSLSPPKSAMPLDQSGELTIFSKMFQRGESITILGETPKRRRSKTTPNAKALPNISPTRRPTTTATGRMHSSTRSRLTPRLHTAPARQSVF